MRSYKRREQDTAGDARSCAGVNRRDRHLRPLGRHRVTRHRFGQGEHRQLRAHQDAGDEKQTE
jgi:hypothetical protein